MRWVLAGCVLLGCGAAPRPRPAAAELPVTRVADIAGDWVADDDMSWSYALTIRPDGGLAGRIDRGKLPRCDQEGTLTAGGAARRFTLAYRKNTCDAQHTGAGVAAVEVASFTGDALTLVVTQGGTAERRTYQRRPE